jgi:hypothetical protein
MRGRGGSSRVSDRPKPIQKGQNEGNRDDHESATMNLCNQYSSEEKRKHHKKHSDGQAKSIGMGLLSSQHGESSSDGSVYEKSRYGR